MGCIKVEWQSEANIRQRDAQMEAKSHHIHSTMPFSSTQSVPNISVTLCVGLEGVRNQPRLNWGSSSFVSNASISIYSTMACQVNTVSAQFCHVVCRLRRRHNQPHSTHGSTSFVSRIRVKQSDPHAHVGSTVHAAGANTGVSYTHQWS